MSEQFDMFDKRPTGRKLAEDGAQRAADHADRVIASWSERAGDALTAFVKSGAEFTSEDVREYAEQAGLPAPPDGRAWGAVILRARKAGLIRLVRYSPGRNPVCHSRPMAVWVKS